MYSECEIWKLYAEPTSRRISSFIIFSTKLSENAAIQSYLKEVIFI